MYKIIGALILSGLLLVVINQYWKTATVKETNQVIANLEKRPYESMKTSVIVPCHHKHFYLIDDLLTYYKNQTVLPDEIVISVSECDQIPKEDMTNIEHKKWPFAVKIVRNAEVLYGGGNRNRACENSSGDLLICQDADDVPHPQRVEIIKYLFENYKIDDFMHLWIYPDSTSFENYDCKNLVDHCSYYQDFQQARDSGDVHCGNVAITKKVFEKVKWPLYQQIGEDQEFDSRVYETHKYNVVLQVPLLLYRWQLSEYQRDNVAEDSDE